MCSLMPSPVWVHVEATDYFRDVFLSCFLTVLFQTGSVMNLEPTVWAGHAAVARGLVGI